MMAATVLAARGTKYSAGKKEEDQEKKKVINRSKKDNGMIR
jgi:hypothetical protein